MRFQWLWSTWDGSWIKAFRLLRDQYLIWDLNSWLEFHCYKYHDLRINHFASSLYDGTILNDGMRRWKSHYCLEEEWICDTIGLAKTTSRLLGFQCARMAMMTFLFIWKIRHSTKTSWTHLGDSRQRHGLWDISLGETELIFSNNLYWPNTVHQISTLAGRNDMCDSSSFIEVVHCLLHQLFV